MDSHKDLDVWKEAIELSRLVYDATRSYPKEERFGLISQMRRASVSVVSNIAEGAARQGKREFVRFLYVAAGSASEIDAQIEVSKAIGFGNRHSLEATSNQTASVARLIRGLIRALEAK